MISTFLLTISLAWSCTSTHVPLVEVPGMPAASITRTEPATHLGSGTTGYPESLLVSESAAASPAGSTLSPGATDAHWSAADADAESANYAFQRDDSLEVHGSLWFYFGRRWLSDGKFWSPIEEPAVGGFEVMYEFVKEFPLEIEFGFLYSNDEEEDTTAGIREEYESFEVYLGLRKSWDIDFFATHLYVGTGIDFNWVEAKLQDGSGSTHTTKDQTVGAYVHTGFFVPLGTHLVGGVDLRGMMAGKMDLAGNSVSADYIQAMFLAGFYW